MAIELQLFDIRVTMSTPLNSQTQPEGGRLGSTEFSLACSIHFCKYLYLKKSKVLSGSYFEISSCTTLYRNRENNNQINWIRTQPISE